MDHARIRGTANECSAVDVAAQIAETSVDGILAFDVELRATLWNRTMEHIFGIPASDVVGKPLLEALPFLAEERERLNRVLEGVSIPPSRRSFPIPASGRPGFYQAHYAPILGTGGSIGGGYVLIRDATEQHRAEQLLQESEIRFRTMADTAPVLLWMAGPDALCTFFNQGWVNFTGRTLEMERGNGWAEGVHPEDFQSCMTVYLSAFVDRREFRMEYRLRRRDGKYRWVLDTGRPRFSADGLFEGYIGSCIDITDLKDAAAALQNVNDALDERVRRRTAEIKRANEELEAFSYSVSHDLRAPLRAVDGFSRILLENYSASLDGQGQHYLDRICSGAKRMAALIDDLLSLSRLTRGELRLARVDLSALAESVVQEIQKTAPERRVEVAIAPGMTATGDERLLRIALENLLGNAWKFTRNCAEPRIAMDLTRGEGKPAYFVKDNGAGFEMAYAARLFGPFQRLHREAEFEGTGIGLATVARIINRHGGRIWAEAEVGKGATFYFTLGDNGGSNA